MKPVKPSKSSRPKSSNFSKFREMSYSNTWQTTLNVTLIVFITVNLTIWLFWRSLYLPELKNHARYLATELIILDEISSNPNNNYLGLEKLRDKMHTKIVTNPEKFPQVTKKIVAEIFTDTMRKEIEQQLGREVIVYFKFKPTSQLWVRDSKHSEYWLREPVIYYSEYDSITLFGYVLGIPILCILAIILLARQLSRPLRQLQRAANNFNQHGHATTLTTKSGSTEIRQVNLAFNRLFTTLNQAQKERTIMLAGISHDLRTPLTRMRLTAELLPDEFLREGLVYDIEDMDAILEQFISFMKDGSDEPVRLTNLDTIIHEIIVQFSPISFEYTSKSLPMIPLRPLSIKRLIINLVNNANRYGEPPIYVSAEIIPTFNEYNENTDSNLIDENSHEGSGTLVSWAQQASEELIICVRDCGSGVEESELKRIMQPFERGETARTTQGSGLGLAIVDRISHLHHGYVEASNHPEGGLQLRIHIPLISEVTEK